MPQSLAKNLIHLIFSTKNRDACLTQAIRPQLFAYSIGESQVRGVRRYIEEQADHHRTRSFQEELRLFRRRYGIDYDERYVWDRLRCCAPSGRAM